MLTSGGEEGQVGKTRDVQSRMASFDVRTAVGDEGGTLEQRECVRVPSRHWQSAGGATRAKHTGAHHVINLDFHLKSHQAGNDHRPYPTKLVPATSDK